MSFRIERLWAFVSQENPGGDEGVIAALVGTHWMPLVAADEVRLRQLRQYAEDLATSRKQTVRLVKFETRTEVESIVPRKGN